jgi:hypothetical protein
MQPFARQVRHSDMLAGSALSCITTTSAIRNQVGTENLKYAATTILVINHYTKTIHFSQLDFIDALNAQF